MWTTRRPEAEKKSIHPQRHPPVWLVNVRKTTTTTTMIMMMIIHVLNLLYQPNFFVVNVGFSGVCVCVRARACVRLIVIFVALRCAGFLIGHCAVKLER
jgi:tryptophan-rich sensory protein